MSILVFGAVFVDVKGFPEDNYIPTGRNAGTVEIVHGGVARNVAEDIANVELRPTFVSLVDTTAEGREVLENLSRHKVNTEYMQTVPDGMGMWLAVFDSSGDIAGSISKRPELSPVGTLLDEKGDEIFSKADSVVFEIDMDAAIVKRILAYAEKYNVPSYALVSNMSIAVQRRDLLRSVDCFVCNEQEADMLFVTDLSGDDPHKLYEELYQCIRNAKINSMVVTLGSRGAVYADIYGDRGYYPAEKVEVRDTTGAGDAFCAGLSIGLSYGKSLRESVEIGTRLAASVLTVVENVCPRFQPKELGIDVEVED